MSSRDLHERRAGVSRAGNERKKRKGKTKRNGEKGSDDLLGAWRPKEEESRLSLTHSKTTEDDTPPPPFRLLCGRGRPNSEPAGSLLGALHVGTQLLSRYISIYLQDDGDLSDRPVPVRPASMRGGGGGGGRARYFFFVYLIIDYVRPLIWQRASERERETSFIASGPSN